MELVQMLCNHTITKLIILLQFYQANILLKHFIICNFSGHHIEILDKLQYSLHTIVEPFPYNCETISMHKKNAVGRPSLNYELPSVSVSEVVDYGR